MRWSRALPLALPALAIFEVVLRSHLAEVPAAEELERAAALVQAEYRRGDLVVIAPRWWKQARAVLGPGVLPLSDQARADEATYRRLWEVSIRGARAPEAPSSTPELERAFGGVRVRRYRLEPTSEALFDFVDRLDLATVFVPLGEGGRRPCSRRGLRWRCGRRGRDEWIGRETISDLDHRPRRCIWAHPLPGGQPLVVEFHDVPRGEVIEGHRATDYVVGRRCRTETVELSIEVDGREALALTHTDCPSWRPFRVELPRGGPPTMDVAFLISAADHRERHFCFQAQSRRALR